MKLPIGQAMGIANENALFVAQTLTTTTNSTNHAPDKDTLVCHLVVSGTVSGTSPNMVVKLQDSADGVNWTDIPSAAFAAVTATGNVQRLVVKDISANIRAVATITGTTPSFGGVTLVAVPR